MPRIITSAVHDPKLAERDPPIFGAPVEKICFYRREIHYETSVLASRTSSYLTAQSFLVIAFAICMCNQNAEWGRLVTLIIPLSLAFLGILISINAWPGLRAAYDIIDHWYYKQSELMRSEVVMRMTCDELPLFCERESTHKGYRKALLFSIRLPWIFSSFWMLVAVWSLSIQMGFHTIQ
ncbi:hypothetical protein [Pseudomonas fluorescens]|uniref:hypothetical protein n=1 Tax=Pseudomonas fluorescens TaxID=294 RepID=UPI000F836172|nr:hypothetical protein [Pseudomonas fluorescens]